MTNGLDFNNEPSNQELLQIIRTMNVTIGKLMFMGIRILRSEALKFANTKMYMLTVPQHVIKSRL